MSYCLNPNCRKQQNPQENNFCQSCGSTLLLRERYRALRIIGQGGFGKTFLAVDEDKPSEPRCVIKQFLPQVQGIKNIQYAAQLFEQEAVRLDELGEHSQIPELLAYFEQNDQLYLIQEFIDGENLAEELAEEGAFSERKIRQLLSSLLPVLQFVHEHQVIHRDIKPENIIRRRGDGELVLVDFGAAKFVTGTALLGTGTVIGTPQYTAPEQLKGKASFASDLYSLGVSCLHLLTQIEPLDLFDITENDWAWGNYLTTSVSDSLEQILDKMVQMGIRRRYQSAGEVLQELNQVATVLTTPTSKTAVSQLKPFRIGMKYGYKNQMGQVLILPQFDHAYSFDEGLALVKIDSKYGYIDTSGQVVIQPQFDDADNFDEGLALVKIGFKYCYINTTGQVVSQMFDDVWSFSEGFALVKIGSKYGYIDTTGQLVSQPKFDFANSFSKGLALVKFNSKYGYINTSGQLISQIFDDVENFSEGLALVKIDSKYGYIDTTGQLVSQPQFDFANSFDEGLALVKFDSKYGYINTNGQLISQIFDDVENFSEGLAAVKINNKWGYIDRTGQMVIPPKFEEAKSFYQGKARVKIKNKLLGLIPMGKKSRTIDKTGKFID